MKALFSVAILASVMALTACGGGSSDSSGSSSSIQPNTQPTPTTPSTNPRLKLVQQKVLQSQAQKAKNVHLVFLNTIMVQRIHWNAL